MTSRRNLLKAAAVAGFPLVVPSTVFGKTAPSNRVQLAMFGVGTQGSGDMRSHAGQADARFMVVCDPFKSRRDAAANYLNNNVYKDANAVETTHDPREVMARKDIDGCVIATCDHWHIPLGIMAAATGKDAYIEKPLGLSLAWAWRMREVMNRNGRIMQYGTMQRSSRSFRYACELVRNGYIGNIKHVDVWCIDGTRAKDWMKPISTVPEPEPADLAYDIWLGPAQWAPYNKYRVNREGSFHTYEYSIGFLGGWGAHPLDIAQWGLNTDFTGPVEYSGTGKIPTEGLYTTVYDWDVNCKYASGVTMRFMAYNVAKPVFMKYRRRDSDHGTTFFGDKGWISIDRGGMEASDPKLLTTRLKPSDERLTVSDSHARNFIDCIRTRQQPICHLECAIRSDTISHLSDICIRLGRPIKWDPEKEMAIGDETANRMLNRPMRAPYQV